MPNLIILATQRTGSTLLCSELGAIGGLGQPGEHLLSWRRARGAGQRLDVPALAEASAPGLDADGWVGHKIMSDYLGELAAAWGGGGPEAGPAHQARFIEWLCEHIGPTAVIRISRSDRLDQALSRYLAAETGLYFRAVDGICQYGDTGHRSSLDVAVDGLSLARINRIIGKINREEAALDAVCARLDALVLQIEYEALAADREETMARCLGHAGLPVAEPLPPRWMAKVVAPALRLRCRDRLLALWLEAQGRRARFPELDPIMAAQGALAHTG